MKKEAFVRRDTIMFNGIVLLLLATVITIVLCFLNNDRELVFLVFACLSFNIIVAYSLGTTEGLYLSVLFVAVFSGYAFYDIIVLEKIVSDTYISFFLLLSFPIGSFLGGGLSEVVEKNLKQIASVSDLEKLITLGRRYRFL